MQCSSTSFRINPGDPSGSATWATSNIGSNCSEDYIGIEGNFSKKNIFLGQNWLITILGSSQTGYGNFQSVYCGGFLNNHPAATTDAKIKGKIQSIILEIKSYNLGNICSF